jgi:Kef-type K+ transport system membrane component KefB
VNVTDILLDIVVVLLAAKIAAEIAERISVPPVVAEIVAGVIVGPAVLGIIHENRVLEVLGELGVILLLLEVGLELSISDLRSVGRSSLAIAGIGVVVPVALGIGVGLSWGESTDTAIFLGAALAATSVGITARVFSDLGALTRVESRAVLGAAVADDVLGLILLTIVVRVVTAGTVDVFDVASIIAIALAFLIVSVAVGTRFGPRVFGFVDRRARSTGTFVALALAFTLGFALLADAAELAPIVGAFAAGVALSGSAPAERVRRELAPVGHLFIPVFFLQIGVHAELDALTDPTLLGLIAVLVVVASIGKVVAGLGMLGGMGDRLVVGLGMLPRGEVGLIFASIGLAEGVLDQDLYGALVIVVLATTLMAPPLLRVRIRALDARRPARVATPMPPGGWLRVGERVELTAEPSDGDALVVALDAARFVNSAPPSDELLDWLGRADLGSAPWDRRATSRLLELLRDGSVRSWRFLEAAGVLERTLPDVADAVRKRRSDPFLLDPSNVHRFELVDALRDAVASDPRAATVFERLRYPEMPMLAALVLSLTRDGGDPVDLASRISDRLRLGARAEEALTVLVGNSWLLRAAATRLDGLDEEPVLTLATHLATPERARALYLVSLAMGELEVPERDRLDELLARVLGALDQPDLTGRRAGSIVEARRAAAIRLAPTPAVADRIRSAPRAHLLANAPELVVRQAALLDALPRRGVLRVSTEATDELHGRIEISSSGELHLMAAATAALAARGIDVVDASMVTWPDGAVIESYRVRSVVPFRDAVGAAGELEAEVIRALRQPHAAEGMADLEIEYDNEASPWYTLCEIRGRDRPGVLHTIASGFAGAGIRVHSAQIETVGGVVIDRFELTDLDGRKLSDDARRAARDRIWAGGALSAPRGRLGRRRAVRV